MKANIVSIFLIACCLSCNTNREERSENEKNTPGSEMSFDREKWRVKEGKDYPFREGMLNYLLYNDTLRSQNKYELLDLLGEPDRTNDNYLYYMIEQKRLGSWPVHTKTLVIKFTNDYSIEWIKIHE